MSDINYVYVNINDDVWAVTGPAGDPPKTVTRVENVPQELIDELAATGWDLTTEIREKLSALPSTEF